MSEMLGYTVDEMMGKSLYYFMDEAGKIIAEYNVERRKKGIKEEHIFEFIKKDGSNLYANLVTGPILDKNGNYAGAIAGVIDISQRKKLEEEKEIIQNRLFQSQKMESIGKLAGGIAHDFNNLLSVIKGYAELSILNIGKENPVYNDLNEITVIVDRAADLTRQLLLFGRKYPMNVITLDLNSIIATMSKMTERIISANIEVKMNLQPDVWSVNADESQIEQVIMNLVVNAQDAMLNGGILTVKTENVTINQEYLTGISEAYTGRFVQLSIQDTGVGMSSEIIHKIFDPFFTTKQMGKGTGLGLAVVYGIIKQHKGWITVYSEPGKGTIFNIFLPASSEEKQSIIKEEVEYTDVTGHGERILFIEDEKELLECISRALSMNGYVVFTAGNAKEAFETYKKENGNFQLVICDVVLPDKPGNELVGLLLSDNPALKVIFTSGYLDDNPQKNIIHKEGHKFVHKPFKLNALFVAVKEVLDENSHG